MSLAWIDNEHQRRLRNRQPLTRVQLNWALLGAALASVILWGIVIGLGRLVIWAVTR